MELEEFAISEFLASRQVLEATSEQAASTIARVGRMLAERLLAGSKALIFGNGGSAADAQHFAAELVGRYRRERPGMPAIALTTDTSLITAIGNDYGFSEVFARQVLALAQPGDVVIGFSTSGQSPNVLNALQAARQSGAFSLLITGGKPLAETSFPVDEIIRAASLDTPRIQEAHAVIIHILCDIVERTWMQALELPHEDSGQNQEGGE
jgi:D-sedoheptulose 7-phosphate isomerase